MVYGADVRQLRELASAFSQAAGRVATTSSQISGRVDSMRWQGGDSERFRSSWRYSARPKLNEVAEALRAASDAVRRNADEQERASSSASTGAVVRIGSFRPVGSGFGGLPALSPSFTGLLNRLGLIGDLVESIRPAYYAVMIGLTNVGMALNKGSDVWRYFRAAKGGFTTAFQRSIPKPTPAISAALATLDWYANASTHGLGSSEAAASSVDGALGTAASFVPFGGLAYEGSKWFGEEVIIRYTPVEDWIMHNSIATDIDNDLAVLYQAHDDALRRGDFVEAQRLMDLSTDQMERMHRETSGYKGLLNATAATAETLVVKPIATVVDWMTPW